MADTGIEQGARQALFDLPPAIALFKWVGWKDRFTLSGPLKEKMGDDGVIFQINNNRRGIAEHLGLEPWEVEGMPAVFGRLMLQTPLVVTMSPIVYSRDSASPGLLSTDYRQGVTIELDARQILSGVIRLAILPDISWLEGVADIQERHFSYSPSQSETGWPS